MGGRVSTERNWNHPGSLECWLKAQACSVLQRARSLVRGPDSI